MAITASEVQELRKRTNVGMMDCKKALTEADGDMEKAIEILRTRGIAKAQDRAGRAAKEGVIEAYIHAGAKLGVLLEVNSETDFVARTAEFTGFVKDVAMHIAASAPIVVSREDLDAGLVEKEKAIYREQALQEGKPEQVVDKIVDGRVDKYYQEVCLLEQIFVKDSDKTVQDLLTELIASSVSSTPVKSPSPRSVGAGTQDSLP